MVSGWSGTADDGAAGIAGVGKIQTRQAGELVNEEPLTKVRLMTFEPSDFKIAKTLLENPGLVAIITKFIGTPIEKETISHKSNRTPNWYRPCLVRTISNDSFS
jgi:hypothetical protein